jgi:L-ascorbate metabolism protein UlaG (beta-lactamase superfamily)
MPRSEKIKTSPYQVQGKFNNRQIDPSRRGLKELCAFLFKEKKGKWPKWIENKEMSQPQKEGGEGRITFINHATFLIEFPELTLLTDPLFSNRAGPFSLLGPKRKREPGVALENLPPVDIVLVSHNHYDHLDLPSLKALEASFSPLFIVPLGDQKWLQKKGLKRVVELDWWETFPLNEERAIHFVPAQHWSGRKIFDRNQSFWGGFVIEDKGFHLFHAGDTGYGDHFKEIGSRFPIDIALLPLGAYKPQWFLKFVHMNPEEAVQAHFDLKAKRSFGMHHDCLSLSSLDYLEVERDFDKALESFRLSDRSFTLLENGESYDVKGQ